MPKAALASKLQTALWEKELNVIGDQTEVIKQLADITRHTVSKTKKRNEVVEFFTSPQGKTYNTGERLPRETIQDPREVPNPQAPTVSPKPDIQQLINNLKDLRKMRGNGLNFKDQLETAAYLERKNLTASDLKRNSKKNAVNLKTQIQSWLYREADPKSSNASNDVFINKAKGSTPSTRSVVKAQTLTNSQLYKHQIKDEGVVKQLVNDCVERKSGRLRDTLEFKSSKFNSFVKSDAYKQHQNNPITLLKIMEVAATLKKEGKQSYKDSLSNAYSLHKTDPELKPENALAAYKNASSINVASAMKDFGIDVTPKKEVKTEALKQETKAPEPKLQPRPLPPTPEPKKEPVKANESVKAMAAEKSETKAPQKPVAVSVTPEMLQNAKANLRKVDNNDLRNTLAKAQPETMAQLKKVAPSFKKGEKTDNPQKQIIGSHKQKTERQV